MILKTWHLPIDKCSQIASPLEFLSKLIALLFLQVLGSWPVLHAVLYNVCILHCVRETKLREYAQNTHFYHWML